MPVRRRPPPPPVRPGLRTPERLRRLKDRYQYEEKPFDPDRPPERFARPHHFAVNSRGKVRQVKRMFFDRGLVDAPGELFLDGKIALVEDPGEPRYRRYRIVVQPSGYGMTVGSFESKTRARQRLKQLSRDELAQRLAGAMPDDPREIMASAEARALQSLVAVAIHYGVDSPQYQFVADQIQSGVRWPATWHDVEKKMRKNPTHRRNHGDVTKLFAQPYHPGGTGFYMSSTEDWNKGLKSSRHEEFEIQFINGDDHLAQLFDALDLTMAHVELWFDELEHLDEEEAAKLYYLSVHGYDLDESIEKMENLLLFEGTKEDWAENLLEDTDYVVNVNFYFDYEAFGRDLRLNLEDPASKLKADADLEQQQGDEEEAEELRELAAEIEEMSDQEMAEEFIDSLGGIGELSDQIRQMYFNVEAFARDADLSGDIDEFHFAGSTYVAEPHTI